MFDQASRSLIQTDLANIDRVEPPCQDHDPGLGTPTAADTFATVRGTPVQVSDLVFWSHWHWGRCSVSWLAAEISVHVATVLLAQQGLSVTASQSGGGCDPVAPCPLQLWFLHLF